MLQSTTVINAIYIRNTELIDKGERHEKTIIIAVPLKIFVFQTCLKFMYFER